MVSFVCEWFSSILLSSFDIRSVSGVPFVCVGDVHVIVPRSVRQS